MATRALSQTPFNPLPPRAAIAAAVETMLAVLDVLDGDPDVEPNGDELDGGIDEDGPNFGAHPAFADGRGGEPGDAEDDDPDKAVDDDACDGDDDSEEQDQALPGDVPQLRVFANEKGADGEREFLEMAGASQPPLA